MPCRNMMDLVTHGWECIGQPHAVTFSMSDIRLYECSCVRGIIAMLGISATISQNVRFCSSCRCRSWLRCPFFPIILAYALFSLQSLADFMKWVIYTPRPNGRSLLLGGALSLSTSSRNCLVGGMEDVPPIYMPCRTSRKSRFQPRVL